MFQWNHGYMDVVLEPQLDPGLDPLHYAIVYLVHTELAWQLYQLHHTVWTSHVANYAKMCRLKTYVL